jgi:hypothetical protein
VQRSKKSSIGERVRAQQLQQLLWCSPGDDFPIEWLERSNILAVFKPLLTAWQAPYEAPPLASLPPYKVKTGRLAIQAARPGDFIAGIHALLWPRL